MEMMVTQFQLWNNQLHNNNHSNNKIHFLNNNNQQQLQLFLVLYQIIG